MPLSPHRRRSEFRSNEGFALIGLVVAIFIILLFLSVTAPTVARSLRRDRELEAAHRANQYLRAMRLYYMKLGHYPGSLEQLNKTNNVRYLRQPYNDPFTGKPDWRLIKVGENKTTVKGFFGAPLAGLPGGGLGAASGMASAGGMGSMPGTAGSAAGASSFGSATSFGASTTGSGPTGAGSSPTSSAAGPSNSFGSLAGSSTGIGTGTAAGSQTSFGSSSPGGFGSSSPGGFGSSSSTNSTGAPFMGVGLPIDGASIMTVNEKTTYPEWEFLYDPRIEQLRAKVNLFGGGMTSTNATGLGSASSLKSAAPGGTLPGSTPLGSGPPGGTSPTMPTAPNSATPTTPQ